MVTLSLDPLQWPPEQLLTPESAYSRLSASLSMHVLVPLLTACRSLGYLPAAPWKVVTAFTGLETYMPTCLREIFAGAHAADE